MALQLDDLVIRSSSHTPFFGVYLATHGITDALCMCHASVGCKVKTQYHLVDHDGIADAHNRRRYSQFIDEDLIQGSTEQLEDEIRAWQARRNAQLVIIDGSTPVSLQAQPMAPVIKRMEAATAVDVVHVDARNYDDDLYAGWSQTLDTLLRKQNWASTERNEDEVSVLGYPFDRYEADHVANVAEMRRLLWGLGLKAPAIGFAGEDYAAFQKVTQAKAHVLLPYAQTAKRALRKTGRPFAQTGLPMSLGGTKRWLTDVATLAGIDAARAHRLIKYETDRIKRSFELAHRKLRGRRFAIFADAPRAAGHAAILMEVGMIPVTIGTLHFSLGGPDAVKQALASHHGTQPPSFTQWLHNETPRALEALATPPPGRPRDAADGDQTQPRDHPPPSAGGHLPVGFADADVVLGSTIERELLAASGKPFVEIGFPSETHHCLFPSPWLGFNGVLHVLQRVMQALER